MAEYVWGCDAGGKFVFVFAEDGDGGVVSPGGEDDGEGLGDFGLGSLSGRMPSRAPEIGGGRWETGVNFW